MGADLDITLLALVRARLFLAVATVENLSTQDQYPLFSTAINGLHHVLQMPISTPS